MKKIITVMLLTVLAAGCSDKKQPEPAGRNDGRLTVAAVNYPLAYFAGRIGGDLVKVIYPIPAEVDPAFWNPAADEVAAYQAADLVLLNGADYAKWVPKVTLAAGRLVDTSASFADRYITSEDATTHAHGPGGEHAHTGTAFTTWLDFSQAIVQADAIRAALAALRPDLAEIFAANFAGLEEDLRELDARLAELVAGKNERVMVASHPVYQYLARRYGLNLWTVMWEPEEDPGPAEWVRLAEFLTSNPAAWMMWEGEPAEASRQKLDSLGVRSLVFDPCMNRRATGDFLAVMRANLTALAEAYQ